MGEQTPSKQPASNADDSSAGVPGGDEVAALRRLAEPQYLGDVTTDYLVGLVESGVNPPAVERMVAEIARRRLHDYEHQLLLAAIADEHAAAAVEDAEKRAAEFAETGVRIMRERDAAWAHIAELERERDEARMQQRTLRQRIEAILVDEGCDCSCWDDESSDCQHGEPHRCPVEERCTVCRVEAALEKEAQT